MKKILKYILLNVILISLILLFSDYSLYLKNKQAYYKVGNKITQMYEYPTYRKNYKDNFFVNTIQYLKQNTPHIFHKTITNGNKTLLLFGCSFSSGTLLNFEQTIEYKLSKLTNRNIYNFSVAGCGIQHMLYIIQHDFFGYIDEDLNISPPDIAIFIYIPDHLVRLQTNIFPNEFSNGINLQYIIKNNNLEIKDYPSLFIYKTFLVKLIYNMIDRKKLQNELEYKYTSFMLANEIFLNSKKLLQKKYPNIKFVILNYQTYDNGLIGYEMPFMWDILKSEGFIIINSEDLIGRKFEFNSEDTVEDGYHPSEKAWNTLVPALVKKLNL